MRAGVPAFRRLDGETEGRHSAAPKPLGQAPQAPPSRAPRAPRREGSSGPRVGTASRCDHSGGLGDDPVHRALQATQVGQTTAKQTNIRGPACQELPADVRQHVKGVLLIRHAGALVRRESERDKWVQHTQGVTANVMYFDRGTFCVLPLTYFYRPKSARTYLFPQFVKTCDFCSGAAPLVSNPFVRNQAKLGGGPSVLSLWPDERPSSEPRQGVPSRKRGVAEAASFGRSLSESALASNSVRKKVLRPRCHRRGTGSPILANLDLHRAATPGTTRRLVATNRDTPQRKHAVFRLFVEGLQSKCPLLV